MMHTLEVYKADRRTKAGERLVFKQDYPMAKDDLTQHAAEVWRNHRIEVHETMVTRTNLLSGAEYQERYDTPHCCSPSTETYWSM